MAGAPLGNKNASRGKAWRDAIRRALAHKYGSFDKGMLAVASKLVDAADAGDLAALREIGDREDGKPQQSIDAEFRGSLTSVIEALPVHRLRTAAPGSAIDPEPDLLPAPGNGQ